MKVLSRHSEAYKHCHPETFSDHIAFDQFLLALERNLLLHIATGLNMTVVGLAMLRFFSEKEKDLYAVAGVLSFVVAIVIASKGIYDYSRMRGVFLSIKPDPIDREGHPLMKTRKHLAPSSAE